ncbi:MAG: hypothetical protein WBQ16_07590, partial [Nitrososphaeraceae archaeon]
GLGYSRETTIILFALQLTAVPTSDFPLIGSLPWKGQSSSSQVLFGGTIVNPIFFTIINQLIIEIYDLLVFLTMKSPL